MSLDGKDKANRVRYGVDPAAARKVHDAAVGDIDAWLSEIDSALEQVEDKRNEGDRKG